jgi:5-methylcytosine-specific restriction endonuclease McrA
MAPHPSGLECSTSARERRTEVDRHRPSARARGYDRRWQAARVAWLAEHPTCAQCGAPATEVHHRQPHRGNPAIFWDRQNWLSLCKSHHSAATAREMNARKRAHG